MEVLVFKTNVSDQNRINKVATLLRAVPAVESWNFDLDDRDRVLRVVSQGLPAGYIELLLQNGGIGCEELEDVIPVT
jgi:hypothetical protein